MWLLLWILQSFLNALWMIFTKTVVENKKIWNNLQTLFNRGYHFLIIILLLLFWFFDFQLNIKIFSFYDVLIFILATIWLYITYPLRRIAYANEKVSVLQPFAMLFQVFPIIIGFLFISTERENIITFIFALIASFIVIISNINIKNFKINKYSLMVLISSIIKSFQIFATLYFLTKLNPANFYLLESLLIIIISISLMFFKNEFSQIKIIEKKYLKLLIWTNSIIIISILLSLTMYTTLWVVATSLISLLYLVFVYFLWYIIIKEIPSKKDIFITILVSLCVLIWLYFKN